jgi:HEAT repeat protein
MQLLQAGTFLGAQFAPLRPEYIAALRAAATAVDPELRRSALDVLVNMKDEFARKKLLEGLQGIGEALVPPAAALGLLARDDHGSASAIARDLLTKSADGAIRAQAARVLGSDPGATELLSEIMNDKMEFREVRRASAVALKSLNPKLFEQGALDILKDGDDFKEIKSTVGGALGRDGISFDEVPSKTQ